MPSRTSRSGWPAAGESQDPSVAGEGEEEQLPAVFEDRDIAWPSSPEASDSPAAPRGRIGMVLPLPPPGTFAQVKDAAVGLFTRLFHGDVFEWSEHNRHAPAPRRQVRLLPALCLVLAVLAVAGTFAFAVATRAASRIAQPQGKTQAAALAPGGLVLQVPRAAATPPQAPPYQIGAWFGTAMTLGSAQVFVRVSHDSQPVPGVPVSLSLSVGGVSGSYGPVVTDAYGLAVFNVAYLPLPDRQGYLHAGATVAGRTLTFDLTFITIHQDTPVQQDTAG